MNKFFKKGLSLVVAMAVLVGGIAIAPTKQAAAAKSAKIPVSMYFLAQSDWLAGDGTTAPALSKTVKVTSGKKTKVTLTLKTTSKIVES